MIKTYAMLMEELSNYRAPANKLARMVRAGEYTPIVRGLYETDLATPGYLLAGSIYGPSYLSFEFALSQYGLIPEAVYVFTSATFEKKKKKFYRTPYGTFMYRDVPADAYPWGIRLVEEGDYRYQMATPEKALCDKIYTLPPAKNKKELISLLFDNLRIDDGEFGKLNCENLKKMCDLYHCKNLVLLKKILR